MDFYGGWKKSFGDIGADIGFIYYAYPGTNPKIDNKEVYLGASWKFLSAKFFYSLDDYFSIKGPNGEGTEGTTYLDLAATFDLGNGWCVNGHWGHTNLKKVSQGSYSDWKLGVTKDISGWVFGAAYVGTNAKGDCGAGEFYCFTNGNPVNLEMRDAGRNTVVLSVGKTF
jgi:uncharacterized protein (TIGR02001 family)